MDQRSVAARHYDTVTEVYSLPSPLIFGLLLHTTNVTSQLMEIQLYPCFEKSVVISVTKFSIALACGFYVLHIVICLR